MWAHQVAFDPDLTAGFVHEVNVGGGPLKSLCNEASYLEAARWTDPSLLPARTTFTNSPGII